MFHIRQQFSLVTIALVSRISRQTLVSLPAKGNDFATPADAAPMAQKRLVLVACGRLSESVGKPEQFSSTTSRIGLRYSTIRD